MTTTSRPLARFAAIAVLGFSLAACGSSGDAVESSHSLDELGAQLAKDGDATQRYLSGLAGAQAGTVSDDATTDVTCSGGKRRVFRAAYTGASSVAGGDHSAAEVRNAEGLGAQVAFKRLGYEVSTDLDKSSDALPATLTFENDPKSPDQKRTFRTMVEVDGDSFTMTIVGRTACIAD